MANKTSNIFAKRLVRWKSQFKHTHGVAAVLISNKVDVAIINVGDVTVLTINTRDIEFVTRNVENVSLLTRNV